MRTPPEGYTSTAAWAKFELWADNLNLPQEDEISDFYPTEISWETFWPAFRDGYSAGLAEQDV